MLLVEYFPSCKNCPSFLAGQVFTTFIGAKNLQNFWQELLEYFLNFEEDDINDLKRQAMEERRRQDGRGVKGIVDGDEVGGTVVEI